MLTMQVIWADTSFAIGMGNSFVRTVLCASNKGIFTKKHYQKLSNLVRFVVYMQKFCLKYFTNFDFTYNYRKNKFIATTGLVRGSGHIPPRNCSRKLYNLVSSEVLLIKFGPRKF